MNSRSQSPIFEFETLVACAALKVWDNFLKGANLVLFTDNEGTRVCLISGTSKNVCREHLCIAFYEELDGLNCLAWMERMNTASNISGEPSRHDCVDENVSDRKFDLDLDGVAQESSVQQLSNCGNPHKPSMRGGESETFW